MTNDGCAVEFYALLPPMGEPEIVHAAVPAGASILELGCGTGRITAGSLPGPAENPAPERTVELRAGDIFVVPKGIEHKPSSSGGAILMFEPSGTSTTGDRHSGAIPDYVDRTTGHELG